MEEQAPAGPPGTATKRTNQAHLVKELWLPYNQEIRESGGYWACCCFQGHIPLPVSLGAGRHCLHCWFRNTPPGPKSGNQKVGSNIGSGAWSACYLGTSKTNLSLPISLRVESGSCPRTSSKESGGIFISPASAVQEGTMDRGWSECWANPSISNAVLYTVESWEGCSFLFSVKLVFVCWWKE